jgi:hypothetical protein
MIYDFFDYLSQLPNMIRSSYDNFYVSAGNQYYHTFFDIYTFPIIRCMLLHDYKYFNFLSKLYICKFSKLP